MTRITSRPVRRLRVYLLFVAMAAGLGASQPPVTARADATQIVSVSGWMQQGGTPISVDVLVAEPAGTDPKVLEQQALALAKASETPPSDLFRTLGAVWDQFFDHGRQNDEVVQSYNPQGDPTGGAGLAAVTAAEQTWSSVEGSSFRYSLGGTTTRCPSLVPLCPGVPHLDGQNDVGWFDLGNSILGISYMAVNRFDGTILEADVALNRNPLFPWSTDGSGIDLQTVITHEDGHVAGLGHSPNPAAVMYPILFLGQIKRTLSADDADTLRFLYPHKPSAVVSTTRAADGFRILDELGAANDRTNDYEPGGLNARGAAAFVADVPQGEGVFVGSSDGVREIVRSGGIADGLTLGDGVPDRIGSNDQGELAFAFQLGPFAFPFGLGAALFHYRPADGSVQAVVRPGVTPAPGGGVFRGVVGARISNQGQIAFGGLVDTPSGPALGVFEVQANGVIRAIARPGDHLSGRTALSAANPALNDRGDVAFEAVLIGDRGSSLFLRHADSGAIELLVRSGDPAPGGGFVQSAIHPDLNSHDDVLFAGDLTSPPRRLRTLGLFLRTATETVAVARPGDLMPDGSRLGTVGRVSFQFSLNDSGDIAFAAIINLAETAVYRRFHGDLDLAARTGMLVPGIGLMQEIQPPIAVFSPFPNGGALIDARGDVLFQVVTFIAGRSLLLVANPKA